MKKSLIFAIAMAACAFTGVAAASETSAVIAVSAVSGAQAYIPDAMYKNGNAFVRIHPGKGWLRISIPGVGTRDYSYSVEVDSNGNTLLKFRESDGSWNNVMIESNPNHLWYNGVRYERFRM